MKQYPIILGQWLVLVVWIQIGHVQLPNRHHQVFTKLPTGNTSTMVTIQEAKPVPDAIFLPLEVQYIILDYVFLKYHHSNAAYRFIPPEDVLKIFLVCRTWYGHAKKLFYSEVYFFKPLKYYRFATSLLQGPPKGMGKDLARLVRKVIFEVPREENVFRSIIASKVRFASIPRAIEAILRCTPLITWVEIRGCYPGGLETGAVGKLSLTFTGIHSTNPCWVSGAS